MALSFSQVVPPTVPSLRMSVYDVTLDSSYLSGGETVAASSLGLSQVLFATCQIKAVGGTVNVASAFLETSVDPAANKIHIWDETPGEVASTADMSTTVVRVTAFGY